MLKVNINSTIKISCDKVGSVSTHDSRPDQHTVSVDDRFEKKKFQKKRFGLCLFYTVLAFN